MDSLLIGLLPFLSDALDYIFLGSFQVLAFYGSFSLSLYYACVMCLIIGVLGLCTIHGLNISFHSSNYTTASGDIV